MKSSVQFLQAAFACGIMVMIIFSIPMFMAAMPIYLGISVVRSGHFLSKHQDTGSAAAHQL